jgi:glycosyltransferase involved in cell wall biosynthesis
LSGSPFKPPALPGVPDSKTYLFLVVPCFNEQEALPETAQKLFIKIQSLVSKGVIVPESKIMFVDDGSTDVTWELIENRCMEYPKNFAGIKLSRNQGHQNALLCGMLSVSERASIDRIDAAISIDADLQDDIDAIDEMLEKYMAGCGIVYGVRSKREKDSFLKRTTAQGFYRLLRLFGAAIVYNHADFRLMSMEALNALAKYGEVNLFLRGIVPMLGFKTGVVYYERKERFAGISKYPLRKMFSFAFEGITSLSVKPIRFITNLGLAIFTASIGMILYSVVRYFHGNTVSGWSSVICSLWCLGGLILLSIGIVGEYIGKIYLETKHRPRWIIEKTLWETAGASD